MGSIPRIWVGPHRPRRSIASRVGWFGSSIVFQDDAMVMILYWRKCYWLEKEILWTRDGEGLTTRDDEELH